MATGGGAFPYWSHVVNGAGASPATPLSGHAPPAPPIGLAPRGHAPTHWSHPSPSTPPHCLAPRRPRPHALATPTRPRPRRPRPPLTGHAPAHWPCPSPATPPLIGLAPCRPRPHSPATPPSRERQGPVAPSPGRGELATASRIRKRRWRIPWASVRSRDNMRERVTAPIRGEAGARLQTGRAATLRGCLGRGFGAASQPRYWNWRFAKGAPAPGGLGAPKRL